MGDVLTRAFSVAFLMSRVYLYCETSGSFSRNLFCSDDIQNGRGFAFIMVDSDFTWGEGEDER